MVVLPGVIPLEFGTATQVFGRDPHYDLTVCAQGRAVPVPGSGLVIKTSAGLEGLERADTVIVPGYEDLDVTVSAAGCWTTSQLRMTSTRSPDTRTCPDEHSPAGFVRRPGRVR